MIGNIVDIHKEGQNTFRACVKEVFVENDEPVSVINLRTGDVIEVSVSEFSEPLIKDIFKI